MPKPVAHRERAALIKAVTELRSELIDARRRESEALADAERGETTAPWKRGDTRET